MRSRIFNITNLYLVLVALLQLQDVLYEGGEILSKLIIGAFLLISLFLFVHTNIRYKIPSYFHYLNILLIFFSLYGIIHILDGDIDYVWQTDSNTASYTYIIKIYLSLLPIYVFYMCTIINEFSLRTIQWWGIILIIVSIARFYSFYVFNTDIVGKDEITNNFGYLFVGLIPLMIFYYNKTILQFILLTVCMIMIILSMKRGAVLVGLICIIIFAIDIWKQSNKTRRIVLCLLIGCFIIGGIYFIQHLLQTSEYFLSRIEDTLEGNSSLRDSLYAKLWNNYINDASIIEMFIGQGANKTLNIAGNYAHNDWLEILINQGLIGIIIYLLYWRQFAHTIKNCNHISELQIARSGLLLCFFASGTMTLFSMSYNSLPIGLSMTMGICLGQITLYQNKQETIHA